MSNKEKSMEQKFIETGEKLRKVVEEKLKIYQKKLDKEKDNDIDIINILTAMREQETDKGTQQLVIKMLTQGISDTGLKMLGDALKSAHEVVKTAKEDLDKIKKDDEIKKKREKFYQTSKKS